MVDLPQPDSPTMPRVSPVVDVERHPVHRLDDAAVAAEEAALEREVLGQVPDGEEQTAHNLTSAAWRHAGPLTA